MKKINQKGFAPVELALVIIIIGLIAFIAWYVIRSTGNADNSYNGVITYQQPAKSTKKPAASTKTQTTAGQIITTKTDAKYGQYLAGSKGLPLYTYGGDTSGKSNCSGSCLTDWPIYSATSAPATLPANVTVVKRADGGSQYAYKGLPLYTFSGDSAGNVTGDGVSDFHLAKP